jgi:hypothetical protein
MVFFLPLLFGRNFNALTIAPKLAQRLLIDG